MQSLLKITMENNVLKGARYICIHIHISTYIHNYCPFCSLMHKQNIFIFNHSLIFLWWFSPKHPTFKINHYTFMIWWKRILCLEKNVDIYTILNQTSYHSFHWSINWCLFLYKNMKTTARRPCMTSYIQSYPHALPSTDTHTPISIIHFSTGEHILV